MINPSPVRDEYSAIKARMYEGEYDLRIPCDSEEQVNGRTHAASDSVLTQPRSLAGG